MGCSVLKAVGLTAINIQNQLMMTMDEDTRLIDITIILNDFYSLTYSCYFEFKIN